MPNAKDIVVGKSENILLVGDSGTHKTYFMGTVPGIFVFDFDNGMKILRGRDIEYQTFYDAIQGRPAKVDEGRYEFGGAWTAFQVRLNEIGAMIDKGTCPFTALGFDSLTTIADLCMNYVLKVAGRTSPEIRDWGSMLSLMKTFIAQITQWPIQVILTAHIKRDENLTTGAIEKLPLIAGQFAGVVPVYFDEVYYTDVKVDATGKQSFTVVTKSTPQIRQAKSRLGIDNGVETTWPAIMAAIAAKAAATKKP